MYLNLRNIQFPVTRASFSGYENEKGLRWAIEIETEEGTLGDYLVSPYFHADGLDFQVHRWMEIEGTSVSFDAPYSDWVGHRAFSYFGTHDPIPSSILNFRKRQGTNFVVHWEGICDPFWDEPFKTNVPFVIDAEIPFTQIQSANHCGDTDDMIAQRLSQYLNLDDFIQHPIKEVTPQVCYGLFEPRIVDAMS